MNITPEALRESKNAREMLWAFDFGVVDHAPDQLWFRTDGLQPVDIFGRRGSGCLLALFGPRRQVLLVTSEGGTAVVAANLREYVELVVAYPYWQDMLARAGGDLARMQRIFRDERAAFEEEALDDNPEIEEYRPVLTREFRLAEPEDPAGRLHRAVCTLGAKITVYHRDGSLLTPLFRHAD